MFDLNLTLDQHEAEALAISVKSNMDSIHESYSVFEADELPERSFEMYVLSKLYNILPKEKASITANDTDLENTY